MRHIASKEKSRVTRRDIAEASGNKLTNHNVSELLYILQHLGLARRVDRIKASSGAGRPSVIWEVPKWLKFLAPPSRAAKKPRSKSKVA